MDGSPVTHFLGLPPEYWTAIAGIATAFLGLVAVFPILRDWRRSCRKTTFLRWKIHDELEVLRIKLEDARSPHPKYNPLKTLPFEEAHKASFENLKQLFSISEPLRRKEHDHFSEYLILFRPAGLMKTPDIGPFLRETEKMLKTFPARRRGLFGR
jgi:hypothetical protein